MCRLNACFVTKFYHTHRDVEKFCRRAYSGGISWVNPDIKGQVVRHGVVYDYNSMYPSVMLAYPMPVGYPRRFYGMPKRPLYIAECEVDIMRDPEKPACIRDPVAREWIEGEYKGKIILTSLDIENMEECYYGNIKIIEGYEWAGETGVFDDYINHWAAVKKAAKGAERQIAKLYQNCLYGKFGMNPNRVHKIPDFSSGVLRWHPSPVQEGKCVNVAVAAFITAAARRELVKGILNCRGFCYCDTDSVHVASLDGRAAKFAGKTHATEYGCWKKEGTFVRAKYLRQKTYIEEHPDGKLTIAACGCPEESRQYITFDNFELGASFRGKLRSAMRHGGVELVETRFTIREPLGKF